MQLEEQVSVHESHGDSEKSDMVVLGQSCKNTSRWAGQLQAKRVESSIFGLLAQSQQSKWPSRRENASLEWCTQFGRWTPFGH
jgi:hypothetical protein